ncbi:hypothetical protein [Lacinutrix jangbogonensis]|uniref:hypothetical protein n=1 Tax=Lacinutrix jangbogonensis TaxID=1469557 RepID=UPI00053E8FF9|nr:hypothetical protein [Lacinutrix jangbogonensis]
MKKLLIIFFSLNILFSFCQELKSQKNYFYFEAFFLNNIQNVSLEVTKKNFVEVSARTHYTNNCK